MAGKRESETPLTRSRVIRGLWAEETPPPSPVFQFFNQLVS